MLNDPRPYNEIEIDGEAMRTCGWCTYVQVDEPDGLPDHATWCESDAMKQRALAASQAPSNAPEAQEG